MKRRNFIRLAMIFCVMAGTAVFFLPGEWFSRYNHHPLFLGIGGYLFALAIYLPEVILKPKNDLNRKETLLNFQFTLAIGFLLSYAGDLGLYQLYRVGFEYDKVTHFVFPVMVVFTFARLLIVWKEITPARAIFWTIIVGLFSAVSWEGAEFLSDRYLGTKAFGIDGEQIAADTINDVLCNIFGGIVGIIILLSKENSYATGSKK